MKEVCPVVVMFDEAAGPCREGVDLGEPRLFLGEKGVEGSQRVTSEPKAVEERKWRFFSSQGPKSEAPSPGCSIMLGP